MDENQIFDDEVEEGEINWDEPDEGEINWDEPDEGEINWDEPDEGEINWDEPDEGEINWDEPDEGEIIDDELEDEEQGYDEPDDEEMIDEDSEDNEQGWDEPDEGKVSWDDEDYESGPREVYEGDFDGDELSEEQERSAKESRAADTQIMGALQLDKDNFTLSVAVGDIKDILIPVAIKDSRRETYIGLSKSVEEYGVLSPIHVMVTESYADHLLENGAEAPYDMPKYALLDGVRRMFAATKNGLKRINAIIWDFADKDKGSEMFNIISLILNKTQRRSWSETWYMYQVLEESSPLSPGTIEYLLQLEPGDATKLKEIMSRAEQYPQPKQDLLDKKKNLTQAFNALQKEMKEQNQLYQEDVQGMGEIEQAEGVKNEETGDSAKLSDDEVKEILDMGDSFDGELSENDFDEMMGNNIPDDRQTVGDRHPLDPALKAATLVRDGYKCQCCGMGEGYPIKYALSILQSHHKISVANSGVDSEDNIITICQNCHTMVHTLLKNGMKFGVSKETFDELPENVQETMKNIMKTARFDWEAGKRLGKNKEDFRQDNMNSSKFKMPGTDLSENMKALNSRKEE